MPLFYTQTANQQSLLVVLGRVLSRYHMLRSALLLVVVPRRWGGTRLRRRVGVVRVVGLRWRVPRRCSSRSVRISVRLLGVGVRSWRGTRLTRVVTSGDGHWCNNRRSGSWLILLVLGCDQELHADSKVTCRFSFLPHQLEIAFESFLPGLLESCSSV